jgi:hypothetical protein
MAPRAARRTTFGYHAQVPVQIDLTEDALAEQGDSNSKLQIQAMKRKSKFAFNSSEVSLLTGV